MKFYELARECWSEPHADPARLVRALSATDAKSVWALNHLIVYAYGEEPEPIKLSQWRWLVPTVSRALALDPQVMVPQLCAVIGESRHETSRQMDDFGWFTPDTKIYSLDQKVLDGLFEDLPARRRFLESILESATRTTPGRWPVDVREQVNAVLDLIRKSIGPG